MATRKPFTDRGRPLPRRRSARLAVRVATGILTAVSACGGSGTGTTTKDGFAQAPQKDGAFTVWVDSTRLAAAKLYQKQQ